MTDRELVGLAAEAYWAGEDDDVVSLEWSDADNGVLYTHADNQDHNGLDRTYVWNPLDDDGDALRLAVKLKIDIRLFDRLSGDHMDCLVDRLGRGFSESRGDDPCAATRRAIVRAAAEIGRTMKGDSQ